MPRIVTESELRSCITADAGALAAVEEGFVRLSRGDVIVPPILGLEIPEKNGAADVKAAYVRGWDSFAVKLSTRFFDNPERGLSSGSGLMVVLDAGTGHTRAVLLDNGYLTTVRTALAGALASRLLARAQIDTVGVLGAGSQARWQLRALRLVRDFRRVLVHARDAGKAAVYASEMAEELDCEVVAAATPRQAVVDADLLVTTTPAEVPLVQAQWLHPGLHITAMGSDAPHKNELAPDVLGRADRLVCDAIDQCRERGELRHALAAGAIADEDAVQELGDIAAGGIPGRRNEREVTVADLTGVGVQDTAIARLALRRVAERPPC